MSADRKLDRTQLEDEVVALLERIRPIMAGHQPEVQGAVLADCLAMWLAGYHVPRNTKATRKIRDELLAIHAQQVAKLIPINAQLLGTDHEC